MNRLLVALSRALGTYIALRWWVTAMLDALAHPAGGSIVNVAVSTLSTVVIVYALWLPREPAEDTTPNTH